MPMKQEWFGEWFNSPYYHILYHNRDHKEAASFIDNLCELLKIMPYHHILDLGCGKGRHAIYLNKKGCMVDGLDLSEQNIQLAKKFENKRLHFYKHDMRELFRENTYDFVLNMFTSIGYFDNPDENLKTIKAVSKGLKNGGALVIDFLNPYRVVHELVEEEIKNVKGIEFHINRRYENGYIIKDISFVDGDESFCFHEKVQAIRRTDFMDYFNKSGLEVENIFGDYNLNNYVSEKSDRMIFIVTK